MNIEQTCVTNLMLLNIKTNTSFALGEFDTEKNIEKAIV